jgi:hypothetical protein
MKLKRINLTNLLATILLSTSLASLVETIKEPKALEFRKLETTKVIYTERGYTIISIWLDDKKPGARKILLPPYTLIDRDGDYHVDTIYYAQDYNGPGLSQSQADSILRRTIPRF